MEILNSECLKKIKTQLNRRGVVLMYHRVAKLEHDPWWLSVSPAHFEEQMQALKKYGRPVKMQEMGRNLKRFSIGPKEIVLTFDDGYADNFYNARPILEKYGTCATFFITTGATNTREEFWWDEIGRLTLAAQSLPERFELTISGTRYQWQINSKVPETIEGDPDRIGIPPDNAVLSKMRFHYVLWQIISKLSFDEKKAVLREIAKWAGQSSEPRPDHLAMSSAELKALASSKLFEMGAHTVRHPMLSHLSHEKQREEIGDSKNALEELLGRDITSFAYPHGDYSEETINILKSLKFRNACTVSEHLVTRNSDPFRLPRFGVMDWNGDQFEDNLRRWMSYE